MTIFAIDLLLYLSLDTPVILSTFFSNTLKQCCTNPGHQFAMATVSFALAFNMCGPSVWNLFIVIPKEPRILGGP
jgi:hypothetical protein